MSNQTAESVGNATGKAVTGITDAGMRLGACVIRGTCIVLSSILGLAKDAAEKGKTVKVAP